MQMRKEFFGSLSDNFEFYDLIKEARSNFADSPKEVTQKKASVKILVMDHTYAIKDMDSFFYPLTDNFVKKDGVVKISNKLGVVIGNPYKTHSEYIDFFEYIKKEETDTLFFKGGINRTSLKSTLAMEFIRKFENLEYEFCEDCSSIFSNKSLNKFFIMTLLDLLKEYSTNKNSYKSIVNRNDFYFIDKLLLWIEDDKIKLEKMFEKKQSLNIIVAGKIKHHEALYFQLLSRLGCNVLILLEDYVDSIEVFDDKYITKYEPSLALEEEEDEQYYGIETVTFKASKEIQSFMFNEGTGIFKPYQLNHMNLKPVPLITTFEEMVILLNEHPRFRPEFKLKDNQLIFPTIFTRISGNLGKTDGWISFFRSLNKKQNITFKYDSIDEVTPKEYLDLNVTAVEYQYKTYKEHTSLNELVPAGLRITTQSLNRHGRALSQGFYNHSNYYNPHSEYEIRDRELKREREQEEFLSLRLMFDEYENIDWNFLKLTKLYPFRDLSNSIQERIIEKIEFLMKFKYMSMYLKTKVDKMFMLYSILQIPYKVIENLEKFDYIGESPLIIYNPSYDSTEIKRSEFIKLVFLHQLGFDVLIVSERQLNNIDENFVFSHFKHVGDISTNIRHSWDAVEHERLNGISTDNTKPKWFSWIKK